jgi:hypothetical protein
LCGNDFHIKRLHVPRRERTVGSKFGYHPGTAKIRYERELFSLADVWADDEIEGLGIERKVLQREFRRNHHADERVYPEFVGYGPDGRVETVRYSTLTGMLLNELQKQARKNARTSPTAQEAALSADARRPSSEVVPR